MRAFVLGGGGARGAMQVGALRALLEEGIRPDMWVGTSIGALNAAYLAVRGFTLQSLSGLEQAWYIAAELDLLPDSYLWLTVRSLFQRGGSGGEHRIRRFFVDQGLDPDFRFGQIKGPPLIVVAADLAAGCAVLYGTDPDQSVLEGVLASSAIPPWVRPLRQDDHLLMDGGLVSNVPIEPAMAQGAVEIVALDVTDRRPVGPSAGGVGPFFYQLVHTLGERQVEVEKQLAAARCVPVHHVRLLPELPVAVWEFPIAPPLIERGYQLMRVYLAAHPELHSPAIKVERSWWQRLWRRGQSVQLA